MEEMIFLLERCKHKNIIKLSEILKGAHTLEYVLHAYYG